MIDTLVEWKDNAKLKRILHIKAAKWYYNLHMVVGIGVIILSAITGSAGFVVGNIPEYLKPTNYVVSIINVFIAILSSIQYFCRFESLYEEHQTISERYSALSRDIDMLKLNEIINKAEMQVICNNFNEIVSQSPLIPDKILHKYEKKYQKESEIIVEVD